jgi:Alcohol dehydrogenase GroES-like domain/3-hydroxyacyl-CoA dehydrogenase, C-terminal domain
MPVREENAMKAAVLHAFKTPLSLEEVARPQTGADDVLIEVEVCGVCHSDLHVADGDWTQLAHKVKKPLILGHEIVGRVVERGAAVKSVQVGERVGVPWVQWTCGQCEFCREGNENVIPQRQISAAEIVDRCIYALVNEGARILEEGYALRAVDIDIIYLNGYGFPAYRGGPMWHADTVGLQKVYQRICEFHQQHGELWAPAPLLKRLAEEGKTFAEFDKEQVAAA